MGPHTGAEERGPGQRSGLRGRGEKELRPKDRAWGRVDTGAAGRTPGALARRRRGPRGQLRPSPALLLLVQLRRREGRFPGGKERVRCGSRDAAPGGLARPPAGGTPKRKRQEGVGTQPPGSAAQADWALEPGHLGEGKRHWGGHPSAEPPLSGRTRRGRGGGRTPSMTQLTSAAHGLANTAEAGAAAWRPAGSKQARGRDEPFSENSQEAIVDHGAKRTGSSCCPANRNRRPACSFPFTSPAFPA